ncbi:MarR family transcriptional regulator [Clostridium sp. BNL1100]|uniref:MarR family transcriptional regulator n=1 Tax=Clostridium sp. BNL1100 TaxID=755731 RepID=UPI00024A7D6A|nr:MarR family transcriptional regulator [Clostridium sp. BNL1100]AEY64511.1 transcriptional regulator [Clostridium sp. BNL1100]
MTSKKELGLETIIFEYIDGLKFLFFPDKWSSVFLDYSKNEILALLLLYRNKKANMTEIAEYISAPLNTATGVIARLEKKLMVERLRDKEDRRVVNIVLTKEAEDFIEQEKRTISHYFEEVVKTLSDDEKKAALSIFRKVASVLKNDKSPAGHNDKTEKRVKRIIIE